MKILDFFAPSSDGIHSLAGVVYLPEGESRGYVQIVHGMTEHIARYDRLMRDLCAAGYLCFGYDHLGHGRTARSPEELGFFAHKGGAELVTRDVGVFAEAVMEKYGKGKPYCLLGHSMGSFITRLAVETEVHPDKYIIMGTGGKNPLAGPGLALLGLISFFCGEKHISPLADKLCFGSFNSRFGGTTPEDPSPWLTRDEEIRKRYQADPFCTFKFTVSAMRDLIRLMKRSNRAAWYRNVPSNLPILLLSGEEDPVGNYGKGIRQVERELVRAGKQARCILYPEARHEILNDFCYEDVKADILRFFEEREE